MDGLKELQARRQAGFQAFLDGKYEECIQNLGVLVKYFATDQMLLVVLISLQRVGDRAALDMG